jgi:RNA polymerase sigma-70 factor (ECF subfamily)
MLGADFGPILSRAQAGDQASFTRIFRDVNPALLRYLRVVVPDAPEDVASETWLQVVGGLVKFAGDERAFRAWLFTIARHRAADHGRARTRQQSAADAWAAHQSEPQIEQDVADVALERLSTRAILAQIAALPADQAEIVMLRVVAGLSNVEVGRIVGKSPGAVRVTAHRALRRLARQSDRTDVTA